MAVVQAVTQQTGQQILQNQQLPKEGPRGVPFSFDWTVGNTYEVNLINFQAKAQISIVQGAWIDNSANANPVTIRNNATQQSVTCLGGWQGYFPILAVNPVDLFISGGISASITQVIFYNVPIAPSAWPASATVGTTIVSDPILDATVTNGRQLIKDGSLYTPLGYQQLTGMAASTALTVPGGALYAFIEAEAQIVRWRDDGVAPTATIGMTLAAASAFWYDGSLAAFRAIQATAGAILNVSYYS